MRTTIRRALLALALAGCGETTMPSDGAASDAPSTFADGASCTPAGMPAVGRPGLGGCAVCCSGRCGGMGIVATCMP